METNDGTIYASEVFKSEDTLMDKLKNIDYNENTNLFLLNLENSEDILYDIVDYMLK